MSSFLGFSFCPYGFEQSTVYLNMALVKQVISKKESITLIFIDGSQVIVSTLEKYKSGTNGKYTVDASDFEQLVNLLVDSETI